MSWTYDRYGNRPYQNSTAGGVPAPAPSISASTNQVTSLGGTNFYYDANGNLTQDDQWKYTFDAENHIVTMTTLSNSAVSQYAYDGNGLRIQKCVPGCGSPTTSTVYIFSGSKVIAEYDNGAGVGSPSREYLYAGGLKVATYDTAIKYHLRDHLSVRVTTNSSGAIIGEQGHYPFGETWYLNSTTTKEQFTTYERDPESGSGGGTGNDYAMARYYANRLGRFSSIDPLSGSLGNPQSLNHYPYSLNDPLNLVDPTGMDFEQLDPPDENSCGDARIYDPSCAAMMGINGVSGTFGPSGGGYGGVNVTWYTVPLENPPETHDGETCEGGWICASVDEIAIAFFSAAFDSFSFGNSPDPCTSLGCSGNKTPFLLSAYYLTPAQGGRPGGKIWIPKTNGGTWRFFDENGRAFVDVDFGHDHGGGDPHVHPWDWSQPSPNERQDSLVPYFLPVMGIPEFGPLPSFGPMPSFEPTPIFDFPFAFPFPF